MSISAEQPGRSHPIPALGGGTLTSSYSSHVTDNILRVGLNYRFNSGPVVARY